MARGPHHRGQFDTHARWIRAKAYASEDTRCWRCGRTLAEVRRRKPGAKWTAGHLVDGQMGGQLAAECSPCNYGAGAALTNRRRGKTSLTWE